MQALVFPEGATPPQTPPRGIAAGASRPGNAMCVTNRLILKIEGEGERNVEIAYSCVGSSCKWGR